MRKLTPLLLSFLLIFMSCDVQSPSTQNDERITISNDVEKLSQRIEIINQSLSGSTVSTSTNSASFTHLANVKAPMLDGRRLSATAVHISGNYAFVSYHLNGEDYGGALEMIDISDKDNPQIVSSMTFDDTDLNDVTVNGNGDKAWIAGGRNVDESPHNYDENGHKGAIAAEISVQSNQLNSVVQETPVNSYSGNAIEEYTNNLGVTSGNTGGIYILDKQTFTIAESFQQDLAKHFDIEGETGVGMALNADQNNNAYLYRYDASSDQYDELNTQTVVNPTNDKNVVDLRNGLVYAAMGDKGFKVFDFAQSSSPEVASFSISGQGLASGLDADDNYLYMAAGSEGMYVATLPDLNEAFQFDNGFGSANYVESDGEFIFLAKGQDGLNILRRTDGDDSQPLACPFDSNDGTVVEFQGNRLYSNGSEEKSQSDLASVSLAAGDYKVKLFGYDDHRNDNLDRQQQNQLNESFYISVLSQGGEVATTAALGDLNDDSDLATRTEVIDSFSLPSDADQIRAVHSAYPDNSSANSLNAKCAAFKKLN